MTSFLIFAKSFSCICKIPGLQKGESKVAGCAKGRIAAGWHGKC